MVLHIIAAAEKREDQTLVTFLSLIISDKPRYTLVHYYRYLFWIFRYFTFCDDFHTLIKRLYSTMLTVL